MVTEVEDIIRNNIIEKEEGMFVHSFISKKDFRAKNFNFLTNINWNSYQRVTRKRLFEHTVLFYDRVLTKQERDLIEKREQAVYDKSLELDPEYGKGSQNE